MASIETRRWPMELGLTVDQFVANWRRAGVWLDRTPGAPDGPTLQVLALAAATGHVRAELACLRAIGPWLDGGTPVPEAVVTLLLCAATLEQGEGRVIQDALVRLEGELAGRGDLAALGARALLGQTAPAEVSAAFTAEMAVVARDFDPRRAGGLYRTVEWGLIARALGGPDPAADALLAAVGDALGRVPGSPGIDGPLVLAGPATRLPRAFAGLIASAHDRPEHCPVAWTPGVRAALLGIGPCAGTRPLP